jgi:CBS domain-containing protein
MICEKVEMQMADIVGMEESIRHVLKKMEDKNLSIIPVVDEEGKYRGIVRASEIMRWSISPTYLAISDVSEVPELAKVYKYFIDTSHDIRAKDVLEEDSTFVIDNNLRMSQIFFLFAKYGHERMFMVDREKKITGMVVLTDLLEVFNAK